MRKVIDYRRLAYDKRVADHLGVTPAEVRRLRWQGKLIRMLEQRAVMDTRLKEGRY